jgi:YesN/AraC family two-component response regulator
MEQKINILIVDYQKNTRQGLKAVLRFYPFINQIYEARDGECAIRVINEVKPDLVILDVQMPVIDGLWLAKWLHKNRPGIRVIMLTMYSYYEEEALAAGVDRFLVKGAEDYSIQDEIMALFPALDEEGNICSSKESI